MSPAIEYRSVINLTRCFIDVKVLYLNLELLRLI